MRSQGKCAGAAEDAAAGVFAFGMSKCRVDRGSGVK